MLTAAKYLRKQWAFMCTCWKLNLAGAMEFRMSFLLTAGMMFVNDAVWIFYWSVYFTKFPLVNGWEMRDVMMMQAVSCAGYGISAVFFGNAYRITNLVSTGQLDTYLAQPKPVLLHVLISRMNVNAIGDILFGLTLFAIFGEWTLLGIVKFVAALLIAMLIFLFFNIIFQSLAFFIGNAEGIGSQVFIAFISFATYPTDIFKGMARMLLFTIIPAGIISYLPIGLMKSVQGPFVWGAVAAATILTAGGTWLFYRGLKRYSSGNMMTVRM